MTGRDGQREPELGVQSERPVSDSHACSVIVPVYNGAALITQCLDALAAQTVAQRDYQIIVVDDGSTDDTAARVRAWIAAHPQQRICLLQQANAGPAAARNRGAEHAQTELMLFTDADCMPTPNWIASMLAPFRDRQVVGVKGAYLSTQKGIVPRFVQAEYEDRYDRMRPLAQIDFIDTYSAAYRRDIFLDNGGFDPIFTTASVEDQELSFRLARKGYKMVFAPDAQVIHQHDAGVGEYWRRKYYIGFWKALLVRWHPERMMQDSHTPPVLKIQMGLWALLICLLPLVLLGAWQPVWLPLGWLWLALLCVFLVTTAPFARKLARKSWSLVLAAPLLLAVRSVALGMGYLVGTIHFAGAIAGQHQPPIQGWKRLLKRLIDIVGALVGLLFSIPFILIAAIAIKLESPGPVFYQQVRIGENGRSFCMFKLRSMVNNADEQLRALVNLSELPEPVYKLTDDPRVTRVGRILRRTSLDETPQFYNVLIGTMSLVGPRPEEAQIVALYNDAQRRRLIVKPGMTGPMQVNGRGSLSLNERLRLELDYIDNYSLWRDMQILVRTIPAIWRGNGAY